MKKLTKEEMKKIGGMRTGGTCSPSFSCIGGQCWGWYKFGNVEFWATSGETCG